MKYFFVSDLHGTAGHKLVLALNNVGFKNEDPNHMVVCAGDITDGLRNEYGLINVLMQLEKQKQLIAIKGNHDFGPENKGYMNAGLNGPDKYITDEQIKWVEDLPYQLETKHFYLAHGMYMEELEFPGFDKHVQEMMSIHGSPCLDVNVPSQWWGLRPLPDKQAGLGAYKRYYKNIINYCHNSFDKDVYVGHFWPSAVKSKLKESDVEYEVDDKGFVTCGKVHWVDSDVLHAYPFGTIKVKVVEYD